MRPYSEQPQRVGGLQAEQPATDDDADGLGVAGQCRLGVGADRIQIVQCPVDVAAGRVLAGHRWDEWVGAGGQYQCVVVQFGAIGDGEALGIPIDGGHRVAEAKLDEIVAAVVVAGEREQRAVPGAHVGRQADPVVGGVGLLAEHDDPPGAIGVARPQGLDESVPHHAVPDHRYCALTHYCAPFRRRDRR